MSGDRLDLLARIQELEQENETLKKENEKLVDKATPRKPEYEADGYWNGELVYDTWCCPNCKTRYEVDYDEFEYCPSCGQALDWSEEE